MNLDVDALAASLWAEHQQNTRFRPFAAERGILDLAQAYRVQAAFNRHQSAVAGPAVGYKIGLTSVRMQALCGIDHPVSGRVFAQRVWHSGTPISVSQRGHLGIEFECCVRLGRDLPARAAPYDLDEVAAAVDGVAPAFELIDDRHSPYPVDVLSLTADNAWNDGVVLGEFAPQWPNLAEAHAEAWVSEVGAAPRSLGRATGVEVLGHPLEPLRWLANVRSHADQGLSAGEWVMTGSWLPTLFVRPGQQVRFAVQGLGEVALALVD